MPNETILTPEASDEEKLLAELQNQTGGAANNYSLMDLLGWKPEQFWDVRNRLRESGRVQIRRGGPGGTTLLPPLPIVSPAPNGAVGAPAEARELPPGAYEKESFLYDPMLKEIDSNWIRDEGYDSRISRITALAGSKQTGGTWTRPDVSVVGIRKFKFLRDPVFDVISFEVKPSWMVTVQGVFEALAHRQYTTRAYVIYHIGKDSFDDLPEADRIVALAEQHGIGVLLAEEPDDYKKWTERVRARRSIPDPADLNEFLQRVFPASDHDEIIKLAK